MYAVPGASLHTHTHTARVRRRKFSTYVRIHIIRGGCRSDEEKSSLSTNSVSSQILTGEGSIGSRSRVSWTREENTASSSDFAKVPRCEKCIDVCSISMTKTNRCESIGFDYRRYSVFHYGKRHRSLGAMIYFIIKLCVKKSVLFEVYYKYHV